MHPIGIKVEGCFTSGFSGEDCLGVPGDPVADSFTQSSQFYRSTIVTEMLFFNVFFLRTNGMAIKNGIWGGHSFKKVMLRYLRLALSKSLHLGVG